MNKIVVNRIVRDVLVRDETPLEDYRDSLGLAVKREDLCAAQGYAPAIAKLRGVEAVVSAGHPYYCAYGVLDASHSRNGWAVAAAVAALNEPEGEEPRVLVFWPKTKARPEPGLGQKQAKTLGAELVALPGGRSAVVYAAARRIMESRFGRANAPWYLFPNAMKLPETVKAYGLNGVGGDAEDQAQRMGLPFDAPHLIPVGTGTTAAGIIRAAVRAGRPVILLRGYASSVPNLLRYIERIGGISKSDIARLVTVPEVEGSYADEPADDGLRAPWGTCCPYYELRALRWWLKEGRARYGQAIFWNLG